MMERVTNLTGGLLILMWSLFLVMMGVLPFYLGYKNRRRCQPPSAFPVLLDTEPHPPEPEPHCAQQGLSAGSVHPDACPSAACGDKVC